MGPSTNTLPRAESTSGPGCHSGNSWEGESGGTTSWPQAVSTPHSRLSLRKQLPEPAIGVFANDNGHVGGVSLGQLLHLLHLGLLVLPVAEGPPWCILGSVLMSAWCMVMSRGGCRLGSSTDKWGDSTICEEHAGKQTVVLCKRNRAESSLQLLTGVLKTHFDLFVTSET